MSFAVLDQGEVSSYTWTPAIWMNNSRIRSPRFFPLDTILYEIEVANYCYTKKDSVLMNVLPLPTSGLKTLDSICLGETYAYSMNPNLVSYLWRPAATLSNATIYNPIASPEETVKYFVTFKDAFGCENIDSTLLIVNYPPSVAFGGNRAFICQGDTIPIRVLTSTGAKFSWVDNGFISDPNAQNVLLYPRDTTDFEITVATQSNCKTTKTIRINVQKPIQIILDTPIRFCKNEFKSVKAGGGLYYSWSPNKFINDTSIDTPQIYPPNDFTYFLRVSNDCFMDSTFVSVLVDTLPLVKTISDTTIYRRQEILLAAEALAETYEWFPKTALSNPFNYRTIASPSDTTQYIIEVTDGNGCKGRDSVWVNVFGKTVLLVPSGFSPNKDGTNDRFGIVKHLNIQKINSFEVYNRWGELVFSGNDLADYWDGKISGELAQPDTYIWSIKATTYDNEVIQKSGNVTLFR